MDRSSGVWAALYHKLLNFPSSGAHSRVGFARTHDNRIPYAGAVQRFSLRRYVPQCRASIPFGRRSVALNRRGARERSYLAFCDRVCLFDTGSRVEGHQHQVAWRAAVGLAQSSSIRSSCIHHAATAMRGHDRRKISGRPSRSCSIVASHPYDVKPRPRRGTWLRDLVRAVWRLPSRASRAGARARVARQ